MLRRERELVYGSVSKLEAERTSVLINVVTPRSTPPLWVSRKPPAPKLPAPKAKPPAPPKPAEPHVEIGRRLFEMREAATDDDLMCLSCGVIWSRSEGRCCFLCHKPGTT